MVCAVHVHLKPLFQQRQMPQLAALDAGEVRLRVDQQLVDVSALVHRGKPSHRKALRPVEGAFPQVTRRRQSWLQAYDPSVRRRTPWLGVRDLLGALMALTIKTVSVCTAGRPEFRPCDQTGRLGPGAWCLEELRSHAVGNPATLAKMYGLKPSAQTA